MSIKSDNWIIEQAEKNQLIKPFEKEQISARKWLIVAEIAKYQTGSNTKDRARELLLKSNIMMKVDIYCDLDTASHNKNKTDRCNRIQQVKINASIIHPRLYAAHHLAHE